MALNNAETKKLSNFSLSKCLLVVVSTIIISSGIAFTAYAISNENKTVNQKIELITTTETHPNISAKVDILNKVNNEEATVKSVLNSKVKQEEKDKIFLTFYRNLGFYIDNFVASGAISPDVAIETENKPVVVADNISYKPVWDKNIMSLVVIQPSTPVFKTEWGFEEYSSLAINHKYLYENYFSFN